MSDETRDDQEKPAGADQESADESPESTSPESSEPPAATPAAATVLGQILGGAIAKVQASFDGAERDSTSLQIMVANVLENIGEARKRAAEAGDGEADGAAAEQDGGEGEEGGRVVSLDDARAARAVEGRTIDMKGAIATAVAAYVRNTYDGQDPPPEVTVDGEYVAEHGPELLKAALTGVGQAWLSVLAGTAPPPGEAEADAEAAKPEVKFDVMNILAGLMKPPQS